MFGTQQAPTFSICVGGALQFRFRVWWLSTIEMCVFPISAVLDPGMAISLSVPRTILRG